MQHMAPLRTTKVVLAAAHLDHDPAHCGRRHRNVRALCQLVDEAVDCGVWKPPVYNTILHLLTNPIYAGAYAFGRTGSRVQLESGRKRIVRGFKKPRTEWAVLLLDRHEGYVSWSEYERNQRLIADNAGNKGLMVRRAVRLGDTLLAGLIRCGHCGRKLHVAYSGTNGDVGRYHCKGAHINHGTARCISGCRHRTGRIAR